MARDTDGGVIAIQCKCYAPTTTLTKEEIDSFVALSGQKWSMTVDWSSYDVANPSGMRATERHSLRPHQLKAVDAVRSGFAGAELIITCGRGKTFTALRIAEEHVGAGR